MTETILPSDSSAPQESDQLSVISDQPSDVSAQPSAVSESPREASNLQSLTVVIETILLIAIIAAGAYLRFVGLDWDSGQHLHPDERFLTMVSSSISSVKSV